MLYYRRSSFSGIELSMSYDWRATAPNTKSLYCQSCGCQTLPYCYSWFPSLWYHCLSGNFDSSSSVDNKVVLHWVAARQLLFWLDLVLDYSCANVNEYSSSASKVGVTVDHAHSSEQNCGLLSPWPLCVWRLWYSDEAQQLRTMSTMHHMLGGQCSSLIDFYNTFSPAEGSPKRCLNSLPFSPIDVTPNISGYVVRTGHLMVTEG